MNIPELEKNPKFDKLLKSVNINTERGYAWIDLNTAFLEREKKNLDDEYLAKDLYIFLANWGMFRNSFLMDHNYRILVPVVKILKKQKYKILQNPDIAVIREKINEEKISQSFCKKSINQICDFYEKNETEISKLRQKYTNPDGKPFPPMKFLDLLFWASATLNPKNKTSSN